MHRAAIGIGVGVILLNAIVEHLPLGIRIGHALLDRFSITGLFWTHNSARAGTAVERLLGRVSRWIPHVLTQEPI